MVWPATCRKLFGFGYFFKCLFIYFERERERGRERTSKGGAEREKEKERILSRLHTVNAEPEVGLELTNHEIMT